MSEVKVHLRRIEGFPVMIAIAEKDHEYCVGYSVSSPALFDEGFASRLAERAARNKLDTRFAHIATRRAENRRAAE